MSQYTKDSTPNDPPRMSVERLRVLLDTYGASPEHWPDAERAAAEALVNRSEEARKAQAAAARLEDLLDLVQPPQPSGALVERLLRRGPRDGRAEAMSRGRLVTLFAGKWLSRPVMQPAAFIVVGLLGVAVGLAIPRAEDPRHTPLETVGHPVVSGASENFLASELFESDYRGDFVSEPSMDRLDLAVVDATFAESPWRSQAAHAAPRGIVTSIGEELDPADREPLARVTFLNTRSRSEGLGSLYGIPLH